MPITGEIRKHSYHIIYIDADGKLDWISVTSPEEVSQAMLEDKVSSSCIVVRGLLFTNIYDVFGIGHEVINDLVKLTLKEAGTNDAQGNVEG